MGHHDDTLSSCSDFDVSGSNSESSDYGIDEESTYLVKLAKVSKIC